jgi:hypothetical protein
MARTIGVPVTGPRDAGLVAGLADREQHSLHRRLGHLRSISGTGLALPFCARATAWPDISLFEEHNDVTSPGAAPFNYARSLNALVPGSVMKSGSPASPRANGSQDPSVCHSCRDL